MDRSRNTPGFPRPVHIGRRTGNRARATVDPVPDRIRPLPVRAPVLPVLTGPLPDLEDLPEPPEPSEELSLQTAWLEGTPVEGPMDVDADTEEIEETTQRVQPEPRTPRRARPPRRSTSSWLVGSLLGMGVATLGVLGVAWLLV